MVVKIYVSFKLNLNDAKRKIPENEIKTKKNTCILALGSSTLYT